MTSTGRTGYRMRRDEDGKLHKVVVHDGVEGYIEHVTEACWGCTEFGDYGTQYGPFGCEECGYTGRRRNAGWVPFEWTPEAMQAGSQAGAA
jgi:hypothetical protein